MLGPQQQSWLRETKNKKMSEYLEAFKQLKGKVVKINEQLGKELNIQSGQIPISIFNMIHNDLVIGIELFSYYKKLCFEGED